MKNLVLEKIKVFAINELNTAYGFCGVADQDRQAMLNSGDDIKITITEKEAENEKTTRM